jgi:hypothetical protein
MIPVVLAVLIAAEVWLLVENRALRRANDAARQCIEDLRHDTQPGG